ncbi:MAG: hypothetical protein NTY19_43550 [Planctomycetota bacterium]|nr:hypothetical protein [Planctomycetota bacterium]
MIDEDDTTHEHSFIQVCYAPPVPVPRFARSTSVSCGVDAAIERIDRMKTTRRTFVFTVAGGLGALATFPVSTAQAAAPGDKQADVVVIPQRKVPVLAESDVLGKMEIERKGTRQCNRGVVVNPVNSVERVHTALKLGQRDRVPVIEFVVDEEVARAAVPDCRDVADCLDRLDMDGVSSNDESLDQPFCRSRTRMMVASCTMSGSVSAALTTALQPIRPPVAVAIVAVLR